MLIPAARGRGRERVAPVTRRPLRATRSTPFRVQLAEQAACRERLPAGAAVQVSQQEGQVGVRVEYGPGWVEVVAVADMEGLRELGDPCVGEPLMTCCCMHWWAGHRSPRCPPQKRTVLCGVGRRSRGPSTCTESTPEPSRPVGLGAGSAWPTRSRCRRRSRGRASPPVHQGEPVSLRQLTGRSSAVRQLLVRAVS